MSAFDDLQSISPQLLAEGYIARAVHGEQLTLAVVEVEPGAELPEHSHVNEQFGMVIEGSVVFRVGDESRIVEPGGSGAFPRTHRTRSPVATGGAVVIDIFSPPHDDWAARERLEPRPTLWPQPAAP